MEPELLNVSGGWAALGDGWIAYAGTEQEALSLFRLLLLAVKPASRTRAARGGRRIRSARTARS